MGKLRHVRSMLTIRSLLDRRSSCSDLSIVRFGEGSDGLFIGGYFWRSSWLLERCNSWFCRPAFYYRRLLPLFQDPAHVWCVIFGHGPDVTLAKELRFIFLVGVLIVGVPIRTLVGTSFFVPGPLLVRVPIQSWPLFGHPQFHDFCSWTFQIKLHSFIAGSIQWWTPSWSDQPQWNPSHGHRHCHSGSKFVEILDNPYPNVSVSPVWNLRTVLVRNYAREACYRSIMQYATNRCSMLSKRTV